MAQWTTRNAETANSCRGPGTRCTSGRGEKEDVQMYPCGIAKRVELTLWEYEIYKEERDVSEEVRKTDGCNSEKFSTRYTR